MKSEEVKAQLLSVSDWRHPFQLEDGTWVKMFRDWFKDWHLWRIEKLMPTIETIAGCILPEGIKNTRVLDTGCWDGFYGFEFLKRGAGHLKGIDLRKEAIRRANMVKEYFGYVDSEFEIQNLQDIDPKKESFDITLLYGLLYHLSAPIDVLVNLGKMTNSMLLISTYASREPEPILKIKRENPEKDSTGFQEMITTPSEQAVVEMLDFAGFDLILRDYPYPFYERYRNSDFGFFYAIKTYGSDEKKKAIYKALNITESYNRDLKKHQIVHLKPIRLGITPKKTVKQRVRSKIHAIIDKTL